MRLLYVLRSFPAYSETFVAREILALHRLGFAVKICALEGPAQPVVHRASRALLRQVEYCPGWRRLRRAPFEQLIEPAADWVVERALAHRADLLHAHFSNLPATIARVAFQASGIPYVVTAHASDIYLGNRLLGWNLARASLIVTSNRMNKAYLARRFPRLRDRIHYAFGIDLRQFADPGPRHRSFHDPLRLLVVSRLEPVKGVGTFLEACAFLTGRGVRVRAQIAGDGPELRSLRVQAKALRLEGVVEFLGVRSQSDLRRQYLEADLVIQPSVVTPEGQFDNLPNVLFEAMASRVPVIASRIGAIPEAIRHGWNGLLVPPADPEALAKAILRLRADPGLSGRLAERGLRTVQARYDIEKSPLPALLVATAQRQT